MRAPAAAIDVSAEQRRTLESWIHAPKTPQGVVLRAKIILLASTGMANKRIAQDLGISRPTVIDWRRRFEEGGPVALTHSRAGRGRPVTLSADRVKAIVDATLQTNPKGATHWSRRTMAKAQGVSPSTIHRIWEAHGLQPHRTKRFKLSKDPQFTEKLTDVVGAVPEPPG